MRRNVAVRGPIPELSVDRGEWGHDSRTGIESTVILQQGDTFVVPKGTEHKPSSPGGSILMFEPTGTSSTGDRHEGEIPEHVHSTTGREL